MALAAAAAGGAKGQDAPQVGRPVIRVDVREVLVPVVVTDAKGHHVTGLKASDFRVQEDGVEQDIKSFVTAATASPETIAELTAGSAAGSQAAGGRPVRHTYVICLDTLHSDFRNLARTRDALARFFEKEKAGEAQYSIVSIGRQLRVLETATDDPAAVLKRIRAAAFQAGLGGGDAATYGSELNELKNSMYDFCRRCPGCCFETDTRNFQRTGADERS